MCPRLASRDYGFRREISKLEITETGIRGSKDREFLAGGRSREPGSPAAQKPMEARRGRKLAGRGPRREVHGVLETGFGLDLYAHGLAIVLLTSHMLPQQGSVRVIACILMHHPAAGIVSCKSCQHARNSRGMVNRLLVSLHRRNRFIAINGRLPQARGNPMKIIEYKTATGSTLPELDREVNELIKQGFQPFGDPYSSTWNIPGKPDTQGFFQAMVRQGALA